MEKESWLYFKSTGLLHFVNMFLHIFGWCIVIEMDEMTKEVIDVFPARCRFNGFTSEDEKSFKKLRKFMDEDEHLWNLNRKGE